MSNSVFYAQTTTLYQPKMPPQDPKYYSNPHPIVLILGGILVVVLLIFTITNTSK